MLYSHSRPDRLLTLEMLDLYCVPDAYSVSCVGSPVLPVNATNISMLYIKPRGVCSPTSAGERNALMRIFSSSDGGGRAVLASAKRALAGGTPDTPEGRGEGAGLSRSRIMLAGHYCCGASLLSPTQRHILEGSKHRT